MCVLVCVGMFSWLLTSRVALAIVGFLGFVNLYALRVNLSVAMVCMLNQTAVHQTKLMVSNYYSSESPIDKDAVSLSCAGYLNTSQTNQPPKVGIVQKWLIRFSVETI